VKVRGVARCQQWIAAAAVLVACGSSKTHDGGGSSAGGASGQPSSVDAGNGTTSGEAGANEAGTGDAVAGTTGAGGSSAEQAGAGGEPGASGASDQGPLAPLVAAYCAAARSCCASAGAAVEQLSGCEQAFVAQSDNVALAKSGHVEVNSKALAACVDAYVAAKTTCVLDGVLTACHGILVGIIAEGGACSDVLECDRREGPKVCLRVQGSSEQSGICKTPPRGRDGAACAVTCETGANCSTNASSPDASVPLTLCHEEDGLYCALDQRCAAIVAAGGECNFDEACGSGGYCDSTCRAVGRSGDDCNFDYACGPGLACVDDVCRAAPLANGETCVGYPPSFD
jgi:hypothetical protein